MERDVFLALVGRSVMTSRLPEPPPVSEHLPDIEPTDLVSLFRQRAQAVDAVVHGPMSRHGVPRSVVGIATGHGVDTFLAWDDLPVSGVTSALTTAGMERVDHDLADGERKERQLGYFGVRLGITGGDAGLAESGSVVLVHGPGRPRMASLVPDIHVALLEVSVIERTLAHWAHKHPGIAADTTNLVVVTGPSRTGDIEQQLNLGVHGPRHVHVVLVQ